MIENPLSEIIPLNFLFSLELPVEISPLALQGKRKHCFSVLPGKFFLELILRLENGDLHYDLLEFYHTVEIYIHLPEWTPNKLAH